MKAYRVQIYSIYEWTLNNYSMVYNAGILEQSMGAINRVGIGV